VTSATLSPTLRRIDTQSGANPARRVVQVAEVVVASMLGILAALPIVRYLWVVAHRITFPFELEWMEGGSVEVVRRVLEGHGIYGPPSMGFTPWPYTPLYFWVAAAVSKVTGAGFLPLRIVSVGASIAVLWLLYRIVTAATGDRVSGLLASGIYAATYSLSGAWADIGRVDSLFLAFAIGAIAVARRAQTPRAGVLVGFLFFLSFFTKPRNRMLC
jgi:4-amino-4-deoxy-L-arabinose transferase-like glycosyltransferase